MVALLPALTRHYLLRCVLNAAGASSRSVLRNSILHFT